MKVAAFYRFLDLGDPERFQRELQGQCDAQQLRGTILVASEGVNGSIAGTVNAIQTVLTWMQSRLELPHAFEPHWTDAEVAPFRRMRVRLKNEIVTLGRPDLLPHKNNGTYVSAAEWNDLIDDEDVLLIDARNHYEIELGTFPGAVDPGTDSFREFSEFARDLAKTSNDRALAMFCTGGIRCEKATALMLELGFNEVFHLRGGILNYLSEVDAEENRWDGECFVFDSRVAVDRDLAEGCYVQCHACRRPLSSEDLQSEEYCEGVSCPACAHENRA